ncbi:MAG: alpha/beta hydrolase [Eubacterium sp.]|nr:alpha/beta hydrolase [Candidatus Colimonas fimequi]
MNPITYTTSQGVKLNYYKVGTAGPKLVMIHAQSTCSRSFEDTAKFLSKAMQVYLIDCPGHGLSEHNPELYTLQKCGDAIQELIINEIGGPLVLLGHSSGGLLAAYVASKTILVTRLILEDPPFFSCVGERRNNGFNYVDLSTVAHKYVESGSTDDFSLYYFEHQYMWKEFPDSTREKTKAKLLKNAQKFRKKHPNDDLKVIFWPSDIFVGMHEYDPYFGEAFYTDNFNDGVDYEEILQNIKCKTLFMKAKTEFDDDGIMLGALTDEDLERVVSLIPRCEVVRFNCGHGIHTEKFRDFCKRVVDFMKNE